MLFIVRGTVPKPTLHIIFFNVSLRSVILFSVVFFILVCGFLSPSLCLFVSSHFYPGLLSMF